MTRVDRCKDAAHAWTTSLPHCLIFLNSIFPSLQTCNPSRAIKCSKSSSNRYGTKSSWSSFRHALQHAKRGRRTGRRADRQTSCKLEVTPFAMVPCGIFLGVFWAQPRWSLCLVFDVVENFLRFFKCFVPEKRQPAIQWNGKCLKLLYGNYAHIYMRMSNGGQKQDQRSLQLFKAKHPQVVSTWCKRRDAFIVIALKGPAQN